YSITFHMFAIATLLQTLAYPSLWPAYTHAYAQGDYAWIRRTFRANFRIGFLVAVVVVAFLIAFGIPIIRAWAGEAAVPAFTVLLWMGAWNLMLSHLYAASCFLNATGHLSGMTIYGTATAVLNLILSILLVQHYGIAGVIAGTVIAFALANYLPTFLEVRRIMRKFPTAERSAV
ncbi:MAG: polysaccharide biosynthesis C-terminal domain-containing protein, partial [Verrucomicrobiota bacterium]|nr:polysaccharide biosynthesis C-terminal domain-containing protein [Verrucomicrobiota bacterium]